MLRCPRHQREHRAREQANPSCLFSLLIGHKAFCMAVPLARVVIGL